MNRAVKEAKAKRFRYDDHAQRRRRRDDFIDARNFARRLKALRGLTPYEFICKTYADEPESFRLDPFHQMPGLNI